MIHQLVDYLRVRLRKFSRLNRIKTEQLIKKVPINLYILLRLISFIEKS